MLYLYFFKRQHIAAHLHVKSILKPYLVSFCSVFIASIRLISLTVCR